MPELPPAGTDPTDVTQLVGSLTPTQQECWSW